MTIDSFEMKQTIEKTINLCLDRFMHLTDKKTLNPDFN